MNKVQKYKILNKIYKAKCLSIKTHKRIKDICFINYLRDDFGLFNAKYEYSGSAVLRLVSELPVIQA